MNYTNWLSISWSTSRGADTYGYNIIRLDDRNTDERFRCMGGGYDMQGTVFGKWLQNTFQAELLKMATDKKSEWEDCQYSASGYFKIPSLYGLDIKGEKITLDGACGLDCMIRIAESIGLEITRKYSKKGRLNGFFVASK